MFSLGLRVTERYNFTIPFIEKGLHLAHRVVKFRATKSSERPSGQGWRCAIFE